MKINHEIDIIIPFYNQYRLLSRCLRAIEQSGYRNGQITIVNDKSNPDDVRAIENLCLNLKLSISIVSHETNKGFRESILTGVKYCHKPYLFLVNSDTVVTHDFANKLVGVMAKDKTIKAVAPISNHPTDLYQFRKKLYLKQQFDDYDHQEIRAKFEPLIRKKGIFKKLFSNTDKITNAPYLSANCLALDREVFERVGYFHNGYEHGYFEDLDLCCCIRKLGYKLAINEDCFVFHRGQGTYKEKSRDEKEKQRGKNFHIFESRWRDLPEHKDLVDRMHWAGRECPI